MKKNVVTCFDAALVGGQAQAKYTVELGIPADCIFTGYDVVDNGYWSSAAEEARKNIEYWRGQLQLPLNFFLAVGRFIAKKNFDGFLRAYAAYRQKVGSRAWDAVVVGSGIMEPVLRELALSLGIEKHVQFLGYLNSEQLGTVYGLANAFVFPSKSDEQWGLVVNEAMAACLPVLVSNTVGSAAELVIDGTNGFLFDPNQLETLIDGMVRLTDCDDRQRSQMATASKRIIAEWTPELFARNLLRAACAGSRRTYSLPAQLSRRLSSWLWAQA